MCSSIMECDIRSRRVIYRPAMLCVFIERVHWHRLAFAFAIAVVALADK